MDLTCVTPFTSTLLQRSHLGGHRVDLHGMRLVIRVGVPFRLACSKMCSVCLVHLLTALRLKNSSDQSQNALRGIHGGPESIPLFVCPQNLLQPGPQRRVHGQHLSVATERVGCISSTVDTSFDPSVASYSSCKVGGSGWYENVPYDSLIHDVLFLDSNKVLVLRVQVILNPFEPLHKVKILRRELEDLKAQILLVADYSR